MTDNQAKLIAIEAVKRFTLPPRKTAQEQAQELIYIIGRNLLSTIYQRLEEECAEPPFNPDGSMTEEAAYEAVKIASDYVHDLCLHSDFTEPGVKQALELV